MRSSTLAILCILISWPALGATLQVGPDGTFRTLAAAVKASGPGDTIVLSPGKYIDDFTVIRHPLTIRSSGNKARLHATGLIPGGKAIIVAKASLSIQNLIFSNARVRDRNGAGIRHEKGALVVEDSIFESNENGILGGSDPAATVIIRNSQFNSNGHGDGYTHGIYIGKIASLTVLNSTFSDTKVGHHIKSRALSTTVSDCVLNDGTTRSSYAIDLPNGGTNIVRGNTIIQNDRPDNDIIISIGTKSLHPSSSLVVENNQILNFARGGTAVRNAMSIPVLVRGNSLFGSLVILKGPGKEQDNVTFEALPKNAHPAESWQEGPR